jgi:hypothetical protein
LNQGVFQTWNELFSIRDIFGHNFVDFVFQNIENMLKILLFFWLEHIRSKKARNGIRSCIETCVSHPDFMWTLVGNQMKSTWIN